jgi:hypothetical protein
MPLNDQERACACDLCREARRKAAGTSVKDQPARADEQARPGAPRQNTGRLVPRL